MKRIIFLFLFFLLGNYAHTQYDCGYTGSSDGSWRDLTCNMLDAGLTKEEVLAMPILYLDVVFHFETNQDGQNFTCDPDDPILEFSNNSHNLFIPTYLNSVMTEMNDRMSTNLEIDGEFIDSRIRYRFRNGDACNSSFFLEHVNRPINLPTLHDDAIDIILDTHDWGTTGLSPFGGGWVIIYMNILNNYLNDITTNTWDHARVTNHEVGHTFGLDHSFLCDNPCANFDLDVIQECCDTCATCNEPNCAPTCFGCSENMMAYGSNLWLTSCQHKEYWSYVLTHERDYQNYCNDESETETLVYDSGLAETWDGVRLSNADMVISNGTEITLTCDLLMGTGKQIVVERGSRLILDGGNITSICDTEWAGIRVEGNATKEQPADPFGPLAADDCGVVILQNGAIIENAHTAISDNNVQYSWPEIQDYFGALVIADDASFLNNKRAVELMRFRECQTPPGECFSQTSSFMDTHFDANGSTLLVTIWGSDGVSFDNCSFNNSSDNLLQTYNASVTVVNGCEFNNGVFGIRNNQTVPPVFSSQIGSLDGNSNSFSGNSAADIYSVANGSIEELVIRNNRFMDGGTIFDFGLYFDGHHNYVAEKNDIEDKFIGGHTSGSGIANNEISNNVITSNDYGLHTTGFSEKWTYKENCFSASSGADSYIAGDINNIIGTPALAAGNCFSGGVDDIRKVGGPSFTYFIPKDSEGTCYNPVTTGSYTEVFALDPNLDPECGAENFGPGGGGNIINIINILNAGGNAGGNNNVTQGDIEDLDQQIAYLLNNLNLGYDPARQAELAVLESTLQESINLLALKYVYQNDLTSAFGFLSGRPHFYNQVKAYGLLVWQGEYSNALQYLERLDVRTEEGIDFVDVQKINLNYMTNGPNVVSRSLVNYKVRMVALKTDPLSAYARSLWYIMTGETIQIPIDIQGGQGRSREMSSTKDEKVAITMSPNPSDGGFTLSISSTFFSDEATPQVVIYDRQGNKKYESVLSDTSININTLTWQEGIYFVRIVLEGEEIINEKVSVLHR